MGMFYCIGMLMNQIGRSLGEELKLQRIRKAALKGSFVKNWGLTCMWTEWLWSSRISLNMGEKDFHEIGFYYMIASEENPSSYNESPFHGIEGERLIFKWTQINELNEVALFPECLRVALKDMPPYIQHFVVK